ncbi:hypothetical protein BB559_001569 [Furculomyces boomerangus]|uniref:G-patch domain-containing protein n=2 Tax=Harpellales TaxID=61421 RepID=A0A2T9Z1K8_9FUNG|nr:hypothetical protein BB559_007208 [Furculomyces boomerangus]PVU98414.1 hypothetical protein BB559_001569 [Furculomyces boomerangus]PWA01051.1 hypothetical protein BB558_002849 [Smittium angustum]
MDSDSDSYVSSSDSQKQDSDHLFENRKRKHSKEDAMLGIFGNPTTYTTHRKTKKLNFSVNSNEIQFTKSSQTPNKEFQSPPQSPSKNQQPPLQTLDSQPNITKDNDDSSSSSNSDTSDSDSYSESETKQKTTTKNNLEYFKNKTFSGSAPNLQNGSTKKNSSNSEATKTNVAGKGGSSIAWKMMQKMGYQSGKGLGKEKAGMVDPIQVKQRPGNIGIGYKGFKEKTKQAAEFDNKVLGNKKSKKTSNQKRSSTLLDRNRKQNNVTLEEIIKRVEEHANELSSIKKEKIVGMTMQTPTELSLISERNKIPESLFDIKNDIQLGLDLSVDKSEHLALQKSLEERRIVHLEKELLKSDKHLANFKKELEKLEIIKSLVSKSNSILNDIIVDQRSFIVSNNNGEISVDLEKLSNLIQTLFEIKNSAIIDIGDHKVNKWSEWKLDEFSASILSTLIITEIKRWDIFQDPIWLRDHLFLPISKLFDENDIETDKDNASEILYKINVLENYENINGQYGTKEKNKRFYEAVLMKIWIPHVRAYLSREWNCYEPELALNFVENWQTQILPKSIFDHLVNNVITTILLDTLQKPSLQSHRNVMSGNREQTLFLHGWIYPWLSFISMNTLYDKLLPAVLDRLSAVVNSSFDSLIKYGNESDLASSRDAVMPWRQVMEVSTFSKFIRSDLYKKLSLLVSPQVLKIDAQLQTAQSLVPFTEFLCWYDLIPHDIWTDIFATSFIPNWTNYLRKWLYTCKLENNKQEHQKNLNWSQVVDWYLAWKSLIPKNIIDDNVNIQNLLRRALWLMQDRMEFLKKKHTKW